MDWMNATGDDIDEGLDHFGRLQAAAAAQVCDLIRAADTAQLWMGDGARSLVDWVSAKLRVRHSTARRLVGVARRLGDLPVLAARFASGDFTLDQVDAISQMATPETEQGLISEVLGMSNTDLDRRVRRSDPPSGVDERTVWERRRLVRQWNLDVSELKFWGSLDPAGGQIFDQAIEDLTQDIPPNPESGVFDPSPTRAADALVALAATTGDQSAPAQVTVHTDLETLTTTTTTRGVAELGSGVLVPNDTARRLACDAVVEAAVHQNHTVVGVGRNRRTVPGWLRRLLHHRDGGQCRFPGCYARRWLQAHHRHHWADGGPTNLDNLILLCGYHHRFLHEHHWHITGPPDQPDFRKPDRSLYPTPTRPQHPRLAALTPT